MFLKKLILFLISLLLVLIEDSQQQLLQLWTNSTRFALKLRTFLTWNLYLFSSIDCFDPKIISLLLYCLWKWFEGSSIGCWKDSPAFIKVSCPSSFWRITNHKLKVASLQFASNILHVICMVQHQNYIIKYVKYL